MALFGFVATVTILVALLIFPFLVVYLCVIGMFLINKCFDRCCARPGDQAPEATPLPPTVVVLEQPQAPSYAETILGPHNAQDQAQAPIADDDVVIPIDVLGSPDSTVSASRTQGL